MADAAKPTSAQHLLTKLLDYVIEQSKDVDPRGFRLSQHRSFIKSKPDLQGLPGVDLDVKVEGDHVWLRVARLEVCRPPEVGKPLREFVLVSDDPSGPEPRLNEHAVQHHLLHRAKEGKTDDQRAYEASLQGHLERELRGYSSLWKAWAAGELPRRKTVALYGDLFAIKHQMEAEETAKPHELVWGVGVAAWRLPYTERSGATSVDFQYPLLTQALEVSLDEATARACGSSRHRLRPSSTTSRNSIRKLCSPKSPTTKATSNVLTESLRPSIGGLTISPWRSCLPSKSMGSRCARRGWLSSSCLVRNGTGGSMTSSLWTLRMHLR